MVVEGTVGTTETKMGIYLGSQVGIELDGDSGRSGGRKERTLAAQALTLK
jgi:hypothetical protein